MVMVAAKHTDGLIDRLPLVSGRYEAFADLGSRSWFRTGGSAEVLFEPADACDLQTFMEGRPRDVAITIIGFGSNILVRDGGVDGVVIRLSEAFSGIEFNGDIITVGASALDVNVARAAQIKGIAGMEFLSGIPGTIGGAVRMNAGAYGNEFADVALDANVIDESGGAHVLNSCQLEFAYRRSALPEGWVVISARLQGKPGNTEEIAERMAFIASARTKSQPRTRTGGSTFANPPGHKAWELIDRAGCRGLRRGGAMVSEQHCNFLLNTGDTTSTDLELLGEDIRRRVLKETGIHLAWEIQRIGIAPSEKTS
jgi:UDP-N-acetylmuramate dehydrogenase